MKKTLLFSTLLLLVGAAEAQVSNIGLVAKYYFNGGNANDDINANHGVVTGATLTTDRFGNPSSAYSFDGNDYIRVPYYAALNVSTGLTISAWVKQSSNSTTQSVVARWRSVKSTDQYLMRLNMTKPLIATGNPSWSANGFNCTNASVPTGAWNHLVMQWKNNGDIKLYVNGVMTDSTRLTSFANINSSTANDLYIGGELANTVQNYFLGAIDDVSIYNRVLDKSEVIALYNEVDYTTSVSTVNALSVSVFPNPAEDMLNINLGDLQSATVKIYSINGKLLQAKSNLFGTQQFDISTLSAGVYFAEVSANEGVSKVKFVVQ